MKPGRELDALVATKVMGWRILSHWEPRVVKHLIDENQCEVRPPVFKPYSTDIKAAWEVFEQFSRKWLTPRIYMNIRNEWIVEWNKAVDHSFRDRVVGESAPHAICLAALKAVGVVDTPS